MNQKPKLPKLIGIEEPGEQTIPLSLRRKTITINDQQFFVQANDLEKIGDLGRGGFGIVEKVRHKHSGQVMAVKRITTTNMVNMKVLTTDLDVSMQCADCPNIVHFFGALFQEGDLWIFMEVMDSSLDKFYQIVFQKEKEFPEDILGKIAVSVVNALHYLHSQLKVIHRDVKPSNILINRKGEVKMCDFGISGYLKNSLANTVDAGCQMYMAPERIDPKGNPNQYDIRSDVWSLGISMMEMATGKYPFNTWGTPFEQLQQVVFEEAPRLQSGQFNSSFCNFIDNCLQKKFTDRHNYEQLMKHEFVVLHAAKDTNVAAFVKEILDL